MTLERISFKKGREHAPRISKPYIAGRYSKRYWSEEEDQLLRDNYVAKGMGWCSSQLPERSNISIYSRIQKLGIKREGQASKQIRSKEEYAALDTKITELFSTIEIPKGSTSGIKEIARILNEPRWLISQQARKLGLTRGRIKEPNWTSAEDELMKNIPLHDPDKCSVIFSAHGFKRTATAIIVRSKRLNLKRKYTATHSATAAARIVGLDAKTIAIYCIKGIIKSTRRATKRLPQQGGDPHSIESEDLRQFIIDNLELIDFRKVDKFALVDLLVGIK